MSLLACGQGLAGPGLFELRQRDGFAERRGPALLRVLAEQLEDAGNAARLAFAGNESRAVSRLPGQHARNRHFSAVRRVQRLEHIGDAFAAAFHAETFCGFGNARQFVPQRLQQSQNAVGARRRAHHHRAHQALAQFARQIVEYLVARRLDVFEQLLHQLVVVIGERFQHRKARGLFRVGGIAFERNDLRRGVLLVDKGALEREIDKARDDVALEGRNLPQDQLGARSRLQQLKHVVNAGIRLVDLVDEQNARDFLVFQFAQNELKLRDLFLIHFADDDGDIDRRQHRAHVVGELDRARTIEETCRRHP